MLPEPASHMSKTLAGVACETRHSMVQEFFVKFRAIWMHDPCRHSSKNGKFDL